MKPIIALVLATSFSVFAHADIKPVNPKSRAGKIAAQAADIFSVTNLKIGTTAFKVVVMSSRLNGDISATSFIVTGEGAVGGEAGWDNAFLLTPKNDYISVRNASVVGEAVQIEYYQLDGNTVKKSYVYDSARKVLVEK